MPLVAATNALATVLDRRPLSARRLLAAIQGPDAIERVLRAMGLPFDVPELAVARAPPDGWVGWLGA